MSQSVRPPSKVPKSTRLALLLKQYRHIASKCPRTYILFRTIGQLDTLDQLLKFLEPSIKSAVFRQYALKRIRRRVAFRNSSSQQAVKGFINEMKIMKSLEHRHIVQYVGSYTDKSYLGLVMSPVAGFDLAAYNERLCGHVQAVQAGGDASALNRQDQPTAAEMSCNLRTYFGCLSAALTYLHDQNVRHKDIKPQNILISKGNVLFADFGLSRDFADDTGSTTSGLTPVSLRYCAPEVAAYRPRNTSSDIWSLGCVFLEMAAALQGLNVEWIKRYFGERGSQGLHFHTNPVATTQLVQELRTKVKSGEKRMFTWIDHMLLPDRSARPTAARVLEMIAFPEAGDTDSAAHMYCGICCVPDLESDSMDSLADDFDTPLAVIRQDSDLQEAVVKQSKTTDRGVITNHVSNQTASVKLPTCPSPDGQALVEPKIIIPVDEASRSNFQRLLYMTISR